MKIPEQTITFPKQPLTVPTIHLNGTAGADLLDQVREAGDAVREAMEKLQAAAPHGRDYYVKDPPGLRVHEESQLWRANREHEIRLEKLKAVKDELNELAEAIYDQILERESKR